MVKSIGFGLKNVFEMAETGLWGRSDFKFTMKLGCWLPNHQIQFGIDGRASSITTFNRMRIDFCMDTNGSEVMF
jgi:hypothetical protein